MRSLLTATLLSSSSILAMVACGGTEPEGDNTEQGWTTVDLDGDGQPDLIDIDGDGQLDGVAIDVDGDGRPDGVGLDTDGDGFVDSVDTDGDGVADPVQTQPGDVDQPIAGDGDTTPVSGDGDTGGDGDIPMMTGPNPAEECLGDYLIDDLTGAITGPDALWRPYNDGSGGTMTPAPNAFATEVATDGDGDAVHMMGGPFSNWGAGIGRRFDPPAVCKGRSTGVRFRAKGTGAITLGAYVTAIVPVPEGGSCTATENIMYDACNNGHEKANIQLTPTWQTYEVKWSELSQQDGWGIPATFDPKSVYEILFASRPVNGGQNFDFWIDDLELIDDGSAIEDEPDGDPGGDGDGGMNPVEPDCVLDKYMSESEFNNTWFAARRNSFYTYGALCEALEEFPGFANTGNEDNNKREIAGFLANVARETGELDYIDEINKTDGTYWGRGPLQLTHSYNYQAAGDWLGVSLIGLDNANKLSTDPVLTWKASLWFWMHNDGAAKGTCHAAMVAGNFGQTINIINGGYECPSSSDPSTPSGQRIRYYETFCGYLGVSPGSNVHC